MLKDLISTVIKTGFLGLSIFCLPYRLPVAAQTVTSDGTVGTTVIDSGNFTVTGGSQQLTTLFHSFRDFSPDSADVTFQLGIDQSSVETVISRITGGNISLINGQLQLTGGNSPDLFLLNPNGIVFGPNAQLTLPGSFIASTGDSILFENNLEFSATNPGVAPVLTVSTPIGLNLGQNPAAITVNGNGHGLSNRRLPFSGSVGRTQLRVEPNHSLALVAGPITVNGGIVDSDAIHVELGAMGVRSSGQQVQLATTTNGWSFDYGNVSEFAPIQVLNRALVGSRGIAPGNINLMASALDVTQGSLVLIENEGGNRAGDLTVQVSDTVTVQGFSSAPQFSFSSLANYTAGDGQAGDVIIQARQVLVRDRAEIRSSSASTGTGGVVILQVTDLVQLDNSILDPAGGFQGSSGIYATTFGSGDAGRIEISTGQLRMLPGTFMTASTFFGGGKSGDIQISTTESVEVIGTINNVSDAAVINVTSYGSGLAGNLEINTPKLLIQDGGFVGGNNLGSGRGGTVTINASEAITLTGQRVGNNTTFDGIIPSQLTVSTRRFRPSWPVPSGDSGSMIINTPFLELDDRGQILLTNEGTGNGGELIINADRLSLKEQSDILASTNSGQGGSITLNLSEILLMRENSLISTESAGISSTGDGGNIVINSPVLLGLENSDIVANAVQGAGGNININTQGIIGLVPRTQLTPGNDITASSKFGVDGSVEVTSFGNEIITSLLELPNNLEDRSRQIAQSCGTGTHEFSVSGRGGIPQRPTDTLTTYNIWTDLRELSTEHRGGSVESTATTLGHPHNSRAHLQEANSVSLNVRGEVKLVAVSPNNVSMGSAATCAALSAH